nr:MAG TPA: hypothetical protein [Caudoviricetes sp.]
MTREEATEIMPIIQAFSEGRIIEFSSITDVSKAWREVTDFPIGMIKNFKFRIKPKTKYRPFKDAEECWAEMQKHQLFGWVKNKESQALFVSKAIGKFIAIGIEDTPYTYQHIFDTYTFADGLPFGVKVE